MENILAFNFGNGDHVTINRSSIVDAFNWGSADFIDKKNTYGNFIEKHVKIDDIIIIYQVANRFLYANEYFNNVEYSTTIYPCDDLGNITYAGKFVDLNFKYISELEDNDIWGVMVERSIPTRKEIWKFKFCSFFGLKMNEL